MASSLTSGVGLGLAAGLFLGGIAPSTLAQCESGKLIPTDGHVGQWFGGRVSIQRDRVVVGAVGDNENGTDAGAAYVFRADGPIWVEEAKLTAPDGGAGAWFGDSVSIDGDRIAVGAPFFEECLGDIDGDGYVGQQDLGILLADWGCTAGDCLGDLDADGDTDQSDLGILLAHWGDDCGQGPGAVFVFRREGLTWLKEARLEPDDLAPWDYFGASVAMWGDRIVVGSSEDDDNGPQSGSAHVFRREGATWVQEAKLLAGAGNPGAYFGAASSMSDEYIAVGADWDGENGYRAGAVHVFRRDDNGTPDDPSDDSWVEQAKLLASDGDEEDLFGVSVSIDGDYLVVGASWDEPNGDYSGSAYVFRRDDSGTPDDPTDDVWIEQAKLIPTEGAERNYFGESCSISGDRLVVGAHGHHHQGQAGGAVFVFHRRDNGTPDDPSDDLWLEEVKLLASDREPGDWFGNAVSMDGVQVLVGASRDEDNGYDAGSAYVFDLAGADCNENSICDSRDIADGTSEDENGNGIPDECECAGDLDNDGDTDQSDLGILLASWGLDDGGDVDGDGDTDQADLGILLSDWGCVP